MTARTLDRPAPAAARRTAKLLGCLGLLALLAVAGIAIGAKYIPPGQVWHVLLHHEPTDGDWIVVHHSRIRAPCSASPSAPPSGWPAPSCRP